MPTSAGFFAGIGGIEEGLRRAGWKTDLLCEIDPIARTVLKTRFPETKIRTDIRDIKRLPSVDLLAAGFPCQNLSQAGQTEGIHGDESSLIKHVFRLLESTRRSPKWVLLENVPFMLRLDGGKAMRYIAKRFGMLGYTWAYRIIDTRAFGIPQRRRRVLILASKTEDPKNALLADEGAELRERRGRGRSYGFYWTEGNTGIGWAKNAIPALKTGSRISIPSPPAVWVPQKKFIGVPDIRDAERLQGFPANWTNGVPHRCRWRLVGNSVSVPVAAWIGRGILRPGFYDSERERKVNWDASWELAGWGRKGERYVVDISDYPVDREQRLLDEFLKFDLNPLSHRATKGFLERAQASTLNVDEKFLADLAYHVKQMKKAEKTISK